MKKISKIVSVLLTFIMMLSISGCSKKAEAPSAEKAENKVTKITFWHLWKGGEAEELQKVIDEFNKTHPNIQVETLAGTTRDKQLTALTGGNPPDVGYVIDYAMPKWASVGAVAELDEYIKKYKVDPNNYPAPVWEIGKYKGKQYGIPYTMDSYMLYYNKDLLKEAGITSPPETFSQLKEYAEKLTKKDAKGDYSQVGFISNAYGADPVNYSFAFGDNLYDYKNDKVTCTSKANIDALTFMISSSQKPYELEKIKKFISGFGEYESPNNPFFTKQLAMDIQGQWFQTFIKKYAKDLNYGIVPIPYPDGHPELKNGGQIQSGMLYISKASKNKEAAFEFINWLTSDEPNLKFCVSKGSLPATFSGINSPKFAEQAPELIPFVQIMKGGTAKALPAVPFSREYIIEFRLQSQRAYDLEITPEEAVKNVYDKIQPLADEWVKTRGK